MTGVPGENESHIICAPNDFVAIAENGKNQDIAWELVKSLLDLGGQRESHPFPVLREAFDLAVEEQKTTPDPHFLDIPEFTPLSDEGEEELRKMVQGVSEMVAFDTQILDLIIEESAAFFAGQKDIDETVRVIQERVTTYLNQL